jgi:hypothetical protein
VHASLTRRGTNRTGEKDRRGERSAAFAAVAAVAVVAETDREARSAAAALLERAPESLLAPASLTDYLSDPGAPSSVILCATRGPARRATNFLQRAAARLLWPAPPADMDAAIGGLRESAPGRSRARRSGSLRAALLLEGPVAHVRARAALAAAADGGPHEWIVESVRHVRLRDRSLAALARAGVRWSALEPVELVAVYAARRVAGALRRTPWLPGDTPVWVTPGRAPR